MILILSRTDDPHVGLVTPHLETLNAEYLWFDPADFPARAQILVAYEHLGLRRRVLRWGGRDIDLDTVTSVWNRRPGDPTPASEVREQRHRRWVREESQEFLTGLWETLDCLWIPAKPAVSHAGYNKTSHLALAASLGFHVARTLVTNSPEAFLEFYSECRGRLISKVMLFGWVYRDGEEHSSFTHVVQRRELSGYQSVRYAPGIFQEYIPKRLELRVTVVGSRVFAAEIHSQESPLTRDDWRHYDNDRASYAPHVLPPSIEALCLQLVRTLHLSFGTIDLVLTPGGEYVFLEINPNGQWAWVQELAGLPIAEAIADLLVHGANAARGETVDAQRL